MSSKQMVINYMAKERVFRSGSVVDAHPEISKRTVDYCIKELVDSGLIAPVHRGLYYIKHPEKPVSRSEIAQALSPFAVVSLNTSFLDVRDNKEDVFHLVADRGRIGSFDTPLGPISIHGIPKSMLSDLYANKVDAPLYSGNDGFGSVKVASKELASVHIGYLNNERKRKQTYGHNIPTDSLRKVDFDVVDRLSQKLGVNINSFPELVGKTYQEKTNNTAPSF